MSNIFKYLQYIPILIGLVNFIRQAQADYPDDGTGSARLQWVKSQFVSIVDIAQSTGLLKPKLANALREGAEAIITIIVQTMNAVEGGVPPLVPVPAAGSSWSGNAARSGVDNSSGSGAE